MSDVQVENLIDITGAAVDELVKAGVGKEEFLRISLVSGGCSGLSYQMTTDTVTTPFDLTIFENDSVRAVTDKNSFQYLKGISIDFSDDLIDVGFRFTNPNAVSTCGCGNSMSV